MNEDLVMIRELFWKAFGRPRLRTKKFNNLWLRLELLSDWLAGPLSAIKENGHCDYVFKDKEKRFLGVSDVESFRRWCLDIVNEYREEILKTPIKNNDERLDREDMLDIAQNMEELSNLAFRILNARSAIRGQIRDGAHSD